VNSYDCKKGKRKLVYQSHNFYWFIRRNDKGLPKIHILSEDKHIHLERPLLDTEVPVASLYIRQLLEKYFSEQN